MVTPDSTHERSVLANDDNGKFTGELYLTNRL